MLPGTILKAQDTGMPTTVTVRAKAKDAKFIGTSMGGALVTITNVETGELLAKGLTKGSTGNTGKLVTERRGRYTELGTPGAAKFETVLKLEKPVFVTISATAPMAQKQSQATTSTQLWLIPGKDITGDGLILEIPGFVVDVLEPRAHQGLSGEEISIRANLVMMCGCATSDGGLWDSSEYEIEAVVRKSGEEVGKAPLRYSGTTSLFEGSFVPEGEGAYEITVYAYHAKTGNTGVDKTTVIFNSK